jgi:hypothetical protein
MSGVGGGHLLKVQLLQSRLSSKSNLTEPNLTKPKLKSDFLQSEIMLRNGVSKDRRNDQYFWSKIDHFVDLLSTKWSIPLYICENLKLKSNLSFSNNDEICDCKASE